MSKTLTEQQIRKIIENGTGKAAKVCEKKFYGKPKSLTEQWKDGELGKGFYYIKTRWFGCDNKWHYNKEQDIDYLDSDGEWCSVANDSVVEIIGDVPSYDEWKELDDELKELATKNDTLAMKNGRLREQLNEANEVIKKYRRFEVALKVEKGTLTGVYPAFDYLKKWGVK